MPNASSIIEEARQSLDWALLPALFRPGSLVECAAWAWPPSRPSEASLRVLRWTESVPFFGPFHA